MNRSFILSVVVACFLVSCHSAKKSQRAVVSKDTAVIAVVTPLTAPPTEDTKNDSLAFISETYKKILNNHIDFTSFSGKIDLDYEDGDGNDHNANAHLRMYKDSVIWVLLTGPLGIEGVRAYITKDSVKLLFKQDKVYTARSITYLREVTALPLDLAALQNLLLGNPVFLDSNIISYNKTPNMIALLSQGIFFQNLFSVTETDKLVQSSKLDDTDKERNRTCYLTYADYENKKGVNFSQKRTINVADKKKLNVKLDFRQYDFNEKLSFPFSVPKNYSRN